MKPFFSILFSILLLAGCSGGGGHQGSETNKLDITPEQLSVKLDPVCQMSLEQHPIADTTTYNSKLYGFCSPGCKEAFRAEPEKFLSELSQE